MYTLRVRLLAAAAGALGVDSEREKESIVVRLPIAHGFDLHAVTRQFGRSVTSSPTRLYVSRRSGWEEMLVSLLRELGRLERARQRMSA